MNIITKDPYADALLLDVKTLKSGAIIKRDAYADGLLQYVHDETSDLQFPVDEKAPDNTLPGKE